MTSSAVGCRLSAVGPMSRGAFFVLAACIAGAGCGPATATVNGKVYLDGKPLEQGTIMFHPVGKGPKAYGEIVDRGDYELQTGARVGVAPGEYIVTVVANEEVDAAKAGQALSYRPKMLTPPRYNDVAKTDLRATVLPGPNSFDFKLVSK